MLSVIYISSLNIRVQLIIIIDARRLLDNGLPTAESAL